MELIKGKNSPGMSKLKKPLFITLTTTIILSITLYLVDHYAVKNHQNELQKQALIQLASIRAKLESTLNSKLFLTTGLAQHIALNPQITQQQFNYFADEIFTRQNGIISIQLAKNNIVSHLYPYNENSTVLGMRLLELPKQNQAIITAINNKTAILDGPLDLVQGGHALIHRVPIFSMQNKQYWGLATLILNVHSIFTEAGLYGKTSDNFTFSIRRNTSMQQDSLIFGTPEQTPQNAIKQIVSLPNQEWLISISPNKGWSTLPPGGNWLRLMSILLISIITFMTWRLSCAPIRLEEKVKHSTQRLAGYKKNLELLVEKRTKALNKANYYLNEEINKQSETAKLLREKEDRLEKISDATFECILIHDQGLILYINNNVEYIFGYKPEEVIGKSVFELVPPSSAEKLSQQLQSSGPNKFYELSGFKKDGTPYTVEIRSKEIVFEGKNVRIGSIRDITQRKKMQITLEESERNLRGILDNLQETFYRTDVNGKLLIISPSVSRLLDYNVEELLGTKLADLYVDPKGRTLFLKELSDGHGKATDYIAALKKKDGSTVWVSTNAQYYYDEHGDILGVEGTSRDITERKTFEEKLIQANNEAHQANQAKSQFLATINHEIRNPMNGIIVSSELLGHTELSAQQQRYITSIKESGETLFQLIDDVLDLSKIESGKITLKKAPFQLKKLIESLQDTTLYQLHRSEVNLQFLIDPAIPEHLEGDAQRLKQVLLNLLGNAIKFTQQGKIILSAKIHSQKAESILIHFEIEDTGIGFPQELQQTIFEPFFQIEQSHTKGSFKGTGLGLPISKQLVNLMGGNLTASSQPGEGSKFSFDLEFTIKAPPKKATSAYPGEKSNLTILLVEDHLISQVAAKELLSHEGHNVTTANNGKEALEIVKRQSFDIILMDIRMPEMDGIETTKAIRALKDKDKASTPIYALTANVMENDRAHYQEIGIDGIIAKPINSKELSSQLAQLKTQ